MKLNRWTILAIILLLSTVIGLAFRPWVDGPSGTQVVQSESLTLTCPESITVGYHSQRFVHDCSLDTDASVGETAEPYVRANHGWNPAIIASEGFSGIAIEVAGGRTSYGQLYSVRRNYQLPIEAGATFHTPIETEILIRVQYPWPFYVGLGLLVVQTSALIAGLILAISLAILRLIPGSRGVLSPNLLAARSLILAPFLIAPWWFTGRLRDIGQLDQNAIWVSLVAVQVLWSTFVVQIILVMAMHTIDLFAGDDATGGSLIPAPVLLIFTVPIAFALILILLFVRRLTLTKRLPQGWEKRRLHLTELPGNLRIAPYVGVVAAGWVFVSIIVPIYWFGYFRVG